MVHFPCEESRRQKSYDPTWHTSIVFFRFISQGVVGGQGSSGLPLSVFIQPRWTGGCLNRQWMMENMRALGLQKLESEVERVSCRAVECLNICHFSQQQLDFSVTWFKSMSNPVRGIHLDLSPISARVASEFMGENVGVRVFTGSCCLCALPRGMLTVSCM